MDGAIVGLERGFHLLDLRSGAVDLIEDPEPDKPANRINDGKVDRQGRFVAGSMDTHKRGPNGALYRVDADFRSTGWTRASRRQRTMLESDGGTLLSRTAGPGRSGRMRMTS